VSQLDFGIVEEWILAMSKVSICYLEFEMSNVYTSKSLF
jgi:hypothetical protein